ncbi:hypothetical protein Cadr_000020688 [Camelus dromedarius]|uniref:Uncharacterized protein n=1 Tax=Camelus dromedarius TaxID=9838 RepID=A0A5N4D040_CAMDR|nr:hypothetical protein Cadr_000020688 [Camelus dromedarius]
MRTGGPGQAGLLRTGAQSGLRPREKAGLGAPPASGLCACAWSLTCQVGVMDRKEGEEVAWQEEERAASQTMGKPPPRPRAFLWASTWSLGGDPGLGPRGGRPLCSSRCSAENRSVASSLGLQGPSGAVYTGRAPVPWPCNLSKLPSMTLPQAHWIPATCLPPFFRGDEMIPQHPVSRGLHAPLMHHYFPGLCRVPDVGAGLRPSPSLGNPSPKLSLPDSRQLKAREGEEDGGTTSGATWSSRPLPSPPHKCQLLIQGPGFTAPWPHCSRNEVTRKKLSWPRQPAGSTDLHKAHGAAVVREREEEGNERFMPLPRQGWGDACVWLKPQQLSKGTRREEAGSGPRTQAAYTPPLGASAPLILPAPPQEMLWAPIDKRRGSEENVLHSEAAPHLTAPGTKNTANMGSTDTGAGGPGGGARGRHLKEGTGGKRSHGRRRPRLVTPSDSPPIRTACCHLPRAARASQAGAEAPGSRGRRYNLGWQDAQATPWARKEHLETGRCPMGPESLAVRRREY